MRVPTPAVSTGHRAVVVSAYQSAVLLAVSRLDRHRSRAAMGRSLATQVLHVNPVAPDDGPAPAENEMIEKEEIDAKSEELGVHVANVQRDYVFGWLLAGLFDPANPVGQRLSLKGGNAFRKAYFENARFSNDLDFSAPGQLSEEELLSAVVRASEFAGERSGVDFRIADPLIRAHESADRVGKTYDARVYFRSCCRFRNDPSFIRIPMRLSVRQLSAATSSRSCLRPSSSRCCTGSIRLTCSTSSTACSSNAVSN